MEILGAGHWAIWITGVLVFGALILLLVRAVRRSSRQPPQQHSAAAHVARQLQLPEALQQALAELHQRMERGELTEAQYEQQRIELLAKR